MINAIPAMRDGCLPINLIDFVMVSEAAEPIRKESTMKLRPGRRNDRNLYLQLGDEPGDNDPCVGFFVDEGVAELIASAVTSPWHLNEIKLSAEDRNLT